MARTIGSVLKEARQRRGLRVKDVAAKTAARISPSYLSCIENDLRLPSEELLLELADQLGLDRRALYLDLVRAKAPASIRDDFLQPTGAVDANYAEIKELPLEQIVERAAEASSARREVQALRRKLARLERGAGETLQQRWEADAARFRMTIEKTAVEANISIDGDLTLHRNVIGLEPRPGRQPIVAIQHTSTRITGLDGVTEDDGFKLLEYPPDVGIEVERDHTSPNSSVIRILFPDGLAYRKGKDRRVSYSFRSVVGGAYTFDRKRTTRVNDTLSDDKGGRGALVITADKPLMSLELDVRFPRYYVPDDVVAWAGTQEFYEANDNFIDEGVCESWKLKTDDDYRVSLAVQRPLVGMKFGIAWKPVYEEEFAAAKRALQIEKES